MENTTLTLAEMLSVFATLKVSLDPSTNLNFSSRNPKRLKLLDGLALLAVTEKEYDVAAVTMTSHAETTGSRIITKFHFMKNRDFMTDEAEYMNNLCDSLNTCPPHRLSSRLHELVFSKCRGKIHGRLIKLHKTVKEIADLIPSWSQPDQKFVDEFSVYYPTESVTEWPSILRHFLFNELNPDHYFKSQKPEVILARCYIFEKRGLLSYIGSLQLVRRLRKVTQYMAIVVRLEQLAKQERGRRVFALNLLPCPPRTLQPAIPSVPTLINEAVEALKPAMDRFKVQEVKNVAPTVRDSDIQSGRWETESFVHCECGLAVEMRKFTSEVLEIGVSKSCCWPCVQFLKEYAQGANSFCLTASHGKTYHNWLFPLEITHSAYQKLMNAARQEFTSLLMTMNRRRLSDSNASSSPDEMEMEKEVDGLRGVQRLILNKMRS